MQYRISGFTLLLFAAPQAGNGEELEYWSDDKNHYSLPPPQADGAGRHGSTPCTPLLHSYIPTGY